MMHVDYIPGKGKALLSGEHFDLIREYFSVENPAAKFNRHRHFIAKRLYAITPTGLMDIGLIDEIQKFLQERQLDHHINLSPAAQQAYAPSRDFNVSQDLKHALRDYQLETVEQCVERGRGVAVLGTGAGKTLIIATLIENFYINAQQLDTFKCLMIVPDLGLVNQTHNDFMEYGVSFKLTRWTGSIKPDLTANVIIANTSILQSKFDDNEWIEHVDLLIVDETHKAGTGTQLSKMIHQINTPHKFGFTGTLPEDRMSRWNIIGKLGAVLYEKNSHELRLEKFLTNVHIKMMNIVYSNPPAKLTNTESPADAYNHELDFIKHNNYRNRVIQTICNNVTNNVLVLVNHIDHGEILESMLQSPDKQVFFIRGEVEVEDRDQVKAIMESQNNVVCVAISSIFSTGVNIKNIHMIVFAAGGKSFIRTVQSIGRGLRLHDNKSKLTIIDVADDLEYGRKHADKRRQIYHREQIEYSVHKLIEK
jgi:superfamily II DNA or RNA helicase